MNSLRVRVRVVISVSICMVGLIYHTYNILDEFFGYPTIVDVRYKWSEIVSVPSISVCVHNLNSLSKNKLAQKYPDKIVTLENVKTLIVLANTTIAELDT